MVMVMGGNGGSRRRGRRGTGCISSGGGLGDRLVLPSGDAATRGRMAHADRQIDEMQAGKEIPTGKNLHRDTHMGYVSVTS